MNEIVPACIGMSRCVSVCVCANGIAILIQASIKHNLCHKMSSFFSTGLPVGYELLLNRNRIVAPLALAPCCTRTNTHDTDLVLAGRVGETVPESAKISEMS